MAISETSICNMSLARIGSKRINALDTDTTNEAIQCRLHYEQTRDALLRSFTWPFATARATLSEDVDEPDSEWDNQFSLPADFLRMIADYGECATDYPNERWTIEGEKFLSNNSDAEIVYIKKVTDPAKFDSLFVDVLVLQLAKKLIPSLAGTANAIFKEDLERELMEKERLARRVCRQETNTSGMSKWNLARRTTTLLTNG